MKKTVKIKFLGFWPDFSPEELTFCRLLKKHYTIEFSEQPDYVLSSCFGVPYAYCNYEAVRIFYSGENFSPDFNLVDYAIGFDPMTYEDRFVRFPLSLEHPSKESLEKKSVGVSRETIQSKEYFCNFIYGHQTAGGEREAMLGLLSAYKHVECAGRFMNNMPGGWWAENQQQKRAFQARCKFSFAFESTSQSGFITEKLPDALASQSVPIYFGDPHAAEIYNPDAFVDFHQLGSFGAVAERVKQLDEDDEAYLAMLHAPALQKGAYEAYEEKLERFLLHIFEQNQPDAYRRPRAYQPAAYNDMLAKWGAKQSRDNQNIFHLAGRALCAKLKK